MPDMKGNITKEEFMELANQIRNIKTEMQKLESKGYKATNKDQAKHTNLQKQAKALENMKQNYENQRSIADYQFDRRKELEKWKAGFERTKPVTEKVTRTANFNEQTGEYAGLLARRLTKGAIKRGDTALTKAGKEYQFIRGLRPENRQKILQAQARMQLQKMSPAIRPIVTSQRQVTQTQLPRGTLDLGPANQYRALKQQRIDAENERRRILGEQRTIATRELAKTQNPLVNAIQRQKKIKLLNPGNEWAELRQRSEIQKNLPTVKRNPIQWNMYQVKERERKNLQTEGAMKQGNLNRAVRDVLYPKHKMFGYQTKKEVERIRKIPQNEKIKIAEKAERKQQERINRSNRFIAEKKKAKSEINKIITAKEWKALHKPVLTEDGKKTDLKTIQISPQEETKLMNTMSSQDYMELKRKEAKERDLAKAERERVRDLRRKDILQKEEQRILEKQKKDADVFNNEQTNMMAKRAEQLTKPAQKAFTGLMGFVKGSGKGMALGGVPKFGFGVNEPKRKKKKKQDNGPGIMGMLKRR